MNKKNFKNKDASNNPLLLLFFGVIFTGFSIALYFLTKDTEENKTIINIAIIVCGVIGLLLVFYSIYRAITLSKLKKLKDDDTAYVTKGRFVKAAYSSATGSSTKILGMPTTANAYVFQKITYEYKNELGVMCKAKSIVSYTPNQVEYIKSLESFKVKCKGNLSLIVEDIPDEDKLIEYNLFKGTLKTPLNK